MAGVLDLKLLKKDQLLLLLLSDKDLSMQQVLRDTTSQPVSREPDVRVAGCSSRGVAGGSARSHATGSHMRWPGDA
jgi:hypothetical protein